MKSNAIILTGNLFDQSGAKTAHGLVRRSSRYNIIGVIDNKYFGLDAGSLLDNTKRNIPIYTTVKEFCQNSPEKAEFAIIGIAVPGGSLPENLIEDIKESIKAEMSIISGLHEYLSENPELMDLAQMNHVHLIDIRKPKPKRSLKFWSGDIFKVKSPIIAVLGTDCNIGKRTTSIVITDKILSRGINAQMIYTGQTGWLQGFQYGFILDSTYNDFVSGELENAIFTCYHETNPDIILIEGQSALCNPSGPCGAEYLVSAQAKGVILQHELKRSFYEGQESLELLISLKKEIELIQLYGSKVLAITLNTKGCSLNEAIECKNKYIREYNLPVILPLHDEEDLLIEIILNYMKEFPIEERSIYQLGQ